MLFYMYYNRQPLGAQGGFRELIVIMSNEYKQCPNGHYYQGNHCPYCKSSGSGSKTKINFTDKQDNDASQQATETYSNSNTRIGENETVVDDGIRGVNSKVGQNTDNGLISMSGRTVFGPEEDEMENEHAANAGERKHRNIHDTRKMVGWLVSYTLDPLGVDFKIYEGRNIIGRDPECNITVNDNWVSLKHAVLLFRAGKFSISDSQSSHGTFVNDTDIELEPFYLADGDIIKIGQTIFKFRTAI